LNRGFVANIFQKMDEKEGYFRINGRKSKKNGLKNEAQKYFFERRGVIFC